MKKDETVYLHHILDAIDRIEEYTRGLTKKEYLEDGLRQDGVVRQLEIIGEASANLSEKFQEEHSEIPWGQIIALRNRIVHAYFDINLQITWDIVHVDIPPLKKQIEKLR